MATFTASLTAGESKSGTFYATLTPGSTITLTADSAAAVTITVVNAPSFGSGSVVLSTDNNEGGNGDASGIGNGATSWTVPANLTASDGGNPLAFVYWRAYNWRGPGSMTLDGFGSTNNTQDFNAKIYDISPGDIRFVPEGGTEELKVYYTESPFPPKVLTIGLKPRRTAQFPLPKISQPGNARER